MGDSRVNSKSYLGKILVAISFCCIILVNSIFFVIPIKGRRLAEIAYHYPSYLTPSKYTFFIWILIYVLLAAFVLYQFLAAKDSFISQASMLLIRICVISYSIINFIWLLSWIFNYLALSTLIILVVAIFLGCICKNLRASDLSDKDKLFIRLPFSVLYGWIAFSAIINLAILLYGVYWRGFETGPAIWLILIYAVFAVFALIQTFLNRDIAYCLTIIWSYFGLLSKHIGDGDMVSHNPYYIPVLIFCIIILSFAAVYLALFDKVIHRHWY